MPEGERKLAAIMFTDMVGYTALGQRNESFSLVLLDEQRKVIRPVITRHNGREVKTIGDAFLIEFPNAIDAVRCAYDIQRAVREFNLSLAPEKRIHLRIGVHVGEVIESQGDISGDAVNVASRIESLAEDGGVAMTRQVYDHVWNKVDLQLKNLGPQSLKNVAGPIEIYRMVMPWNLEEPSTKGHGDKQRIAILPFANMSPNPADEYFADGLTEELITTVSRISGLRVIARTSVMGYKMPGKKIDDVAQELEVGSVLEGSVRKAGDRIRITVQLIDSRTSENIWAESFDRQLEDVFMIQSEIAEKVAEELKVKLVPRGEIPVERSRKMNPAAYSLYLKGRVYLGERTETKVREALKLFERAGESEPSFASSYSGMADCYIVLADYGWMSPDQAYPLAMKLSKKAMEIDEGLAEAHASYALTLLKNWDPVHAENQFKRAIELSPSYAPAHHFYAILLFNLRRVEEASIEERQAMELDPSSTIYSLWTAISQIYLGETRAALSRLESITKSSPYLAVGHIWKSWAHALISQYENAVEEAQEATNLERNPSTELNLAIIYAVAGKKANSERILHEVVSGSSRDLPYSLVGWVELMLGRTDEGYNSLMKALQARDENLLIMPNDPFFKPYLKDPRWVRIDSELATWHGHLLAKADDAVRV